MPEEKKTRNYKTREYYEDLADYREWLLEAGVYKTSVSKYLRGVTDYKRSGYSIQEDQIDLRREEKKKNGFKDSLITEMRRGIIQYFRYIAGEPFKWATQGKHGTKRCNKDCFNCIYDDCIC